MGLRGSETPKQELIDFLLLCVCMCVCVLRKKVELASHTQAKYCDIDCSLFFGCIFRLYLFFTYKLRSTSIVCVQRCMYPKCKRTREKTKKRKVLYTVLPIYTHNTG